MAMGMRSAVGIGALAGIAFILNTLIPRSFLFPLVWPLAAGGLVVYRNQKTGWRSGTPLRLALAGAAGVVAGFVFLLFGIGSLYVSSKMTHTATIAGKTWVARSSINNAAVVNTEILALVAIPLVAIFGGAVALRTYRAPQGPGV